MALRRSRPEDEILRKIISCKMIFRICFLIITIIIRCNSVAITLLQTLSTSGKGGGSDWTMQRVSEGGWALISLHVKMLQDQEYSEYLMDECQNNERSPPMIITEMFVCK